MQIIRPEAISPDTEVVGYVKRNDPQLAIEALLNGDYILINDFYSTGLNILSEIKDSQKKTY